MTTLLERFMAKWKEDANGCWIWQSTIYGIRQDRPGYGSITVARRNRPAHRVSYELLRGPIPAGMTIDHLCRVTLCVNPAHLEPVTAAENTRRAGPATKTHCVNGHPFDEANTYLRSTGGQRGCRACNLAAVKRYEARKRAAA